MRQIRELLRLHYEDGLRRVDIPLDPLVLEQLNRPVGRLFEDVE